MLRVRRLAIVNDRLDVYVLGAGASAEHARGEMKPVTDNLLPWALGHRGDDSRLRDAKAFLRDVFQYRHGARSRPETFPSLVDVLSVVDMAIDRGDRLVPRAGREAKYDPDRLRAVRASLEYAIFLTLEHTLARGGSRSAATRHLVAGLRPSDAAVISLNYDVVVDWTLSRRPGARGALPIDYGVDFANVGPADEHYLPLLKLHGSFNWLESTLTGDLYWAGWEKEIRRLYTDETMVTVDDRTGAGRRRRGAIELMRRDLRPLMITPTHLKDFRNPHVTAIWRRAAGVIRHACRLTFIGYSLPGDDIHVKYLFKHALATSPDGGRPEIVVVDPAEAVVSNYERFFGYVTEHYPEGFAAFATGLSGRGA